ncbi:hypothetical protein B0A50_03271 [Salinomyces thailandicus]|uniref:Thioesterase domain-containing protein n=1 Tax=Salinomyces thailandicus TaxID=706561 RepID=A0A4U0U1Q1_9PEZI|nr:hypothetical protein B0A50_03271 [Salinomyces thailandica]
MASGDHKAHFMRIPWAATLLSKPNTITRVPGSRTPKRSTEDSLFALTLKSSQTFDACICYYKRPGPSDDRIQEVSTLITIGDGLNGHPAILHGGMVAAILDESMGILQSANHERGHLLRVGKGLAQGELPPHGLGSFTAYLNVRYLKPVQTPGSLVCTARYTRQEGRKEWIEAVVKQFVAHGEDESEEVVCAIGEALFVEPKGSRL